MEDNVKDLKTKHTKKESAKESLEYQRAKDQEMVKGIFKYYEVPGGLFEFCYKAYKPDQVETYRLLDGMQYTIPLGVARHLNKNCWYPVHAYAQDENGKPSMKINEKVRRVGFQSLEFIDIADLSPMGKPLITVENIY